MNLLFSFLINDHKDALHAVSIISRLHTANGVTKSICLPLFPYPPGPLLGGSGLSMPAPMPPYVTVYALLLLPPANGSSVYSAAYACNCAWAFGEPYEFPGVVVGVGVAVPVRVKGM